MKESDIEKTAFSINNGKFELGPTGYYRKCVRKYLGGIMVKFLGECLKNNNTVR